MLLSGLRLVLRLLESDVDLGSSLNSRQLGSSQLGLEVGVGEVELRAVVGRGAHQRGMARCRCVVESEPAESWASGRSPSRPLSLRTDWSSTSGCSRVHQRDYGAVANK